MKAATQALQALKPPDWLNTASGSNIRPPIAIDDGIKELCYSIIATGLHQAIGAIDRGTYGELLYGFRRITAIRWGQSDHLPVPELIPVMLYDPAITPQEVRIIQLTENLQREDISDVQLFHAVVELEGTLGMAKKDIAAMLGFSPAKVTRAVSPQNCPPEAMDYFLAERLTLGHCYKISTSADPLATMAHFLKGGTHDEAEAAARPKSSTSGEKTSSVRIPLALDSDGGMRGGRVSISGLPGQGLDLEATETLLKDALQAVKEARKESWTLKNAQAIWRDRFAAADTAGA